MGTTDIDEPGKSAAGLFRPAAASLPGTMTRRNLFRSAGGVGAVALLAACGSSSISSKSSSVATSPSAGTPITGGTLRLGTEVPTAGIDPWTAAGGPGETAGQLVNEYLFWTEPDGTLRPVLGLSASASADGLTWTVPLRQGVTFNDGTPFDADAVVFSINQLIAPTSQSSAATAFSGILKSVSKADSNTVTFTLVAPFSDFPYLLSSSNYNTFIFPASYSGNFLKQPVGTGAFTLDSYITDQKLTFTRRADYWNAKQIYLNEIDLILYSDDQSEQLALESGEIDAEVYSSLGDAASVDTSKINIESIVGASFTNIALRTDQAPFNDPTVRQAVAWALDRNEINRVQFAGLGQIANDTIFAPSYKIKPTGLTQRNKNLDKVKQLLNGRTISFTLTGSQDDSAYLALLQQQLTAAGFNVKIDALTDNAYYGGSNATTPWLNAEASLTGWVTRPSPLQFLNFMYKSNAAWNASHYKNPALDKLIVQLAATTDTATKQTLTNQIAQILWTDVAVVIPVWNPSARFVSKTVQGFGPDPSEFVNPAGVWIQT